MIKSIVLDVSVTPMYPPGGTFGFIWRSGGHWGELLSIFDRFGASPGRLLGVICAPVDALVVIFGSLDGLLRVLAQTFESNMLERSGFVILVPRLSETTTFEGLAAQKSTIWSQRSRPNGPKSPRRGKSEGPGQSSLAARFRLVVGVMELDGKQAGIKSSRRSKSI